MNEKDWHWMQEALALAEKGRGFVEPNPLVGAILVRDGRRVGQGWHRRYGAAHAEVNALADAGEAARGATLYVTLEPCCHHGKTPPCTEAVIQAGVRRVVAAMMDPFAQVCGQGIAQLRAAGIEVDIGLGEAEGRRLNAPYLKLLATGRPYVHAKWAMTLDGKIATRTGDSRWISNEASRRRVQDLRSRMDAIVVGIGTVLADDPLLTARPPGPRTAVRVILDSHCRLPLTSQLATTARQVPVMVVTAAVEARERAAALQGLGCEWLALPDEEGRPAVRPLLDELGRRGMTNLLVEGGSEVLGSFLDAGEIDEAHVFVAPRLAGGKEARTPVAGRGVEQIAETLMLEDWKVESVEGDVLLHGWKR
jgi:diaminohydroxyphosphoribosylaminopyrimidine deaminase/5-amino-6-(5-phosphoribosylamino)uracil reductase